ncbi:hypothetical protein OEZ85_007966 [Tetradesmus obliquus]|uniref:Tyrosine-protein kinase ephrin type A/B receptor-like domain-containing protein n=1 Tax=Tetradesmus obliquus TaxID=3088 RepID=A0ABY8THU1_TETOB|nr:hypothetical protein OEZ85_007966 [Tetradesmus obliquus]
MTASAAGNSTRREATAAETFLGSNRSDSSGIVQLSLGIRQPPGSYRIKYSLVAAGDAAIPPVLTTLEVRRCMPGEVAPSPDACVACAAGSYSLHPANSSCDACPPGAACPGGSAISPLPGHWHSAATSSQVHRCPNPAACEGDRAVLAAAAAGTAAPGSYADLQCSSGYRGALCAVCSAGYGMAQPCTCNMCMSMQAIIVSYTFSGLAMLAFIKVLCHYTLADNIQARARVMHMPHRPVEQREPGIAASGNGLPPAQLLKPFVLYMQYIMIIFGMQVDWPQSLALPLKALAWVWASASPETLSVECLIDGSSAIPVAVRKVVFYLSVPVVMLAVLLLLEITLYLAACKSNSSQGWLARITPQSTSGAHLCL